MRTITIEYDDKATPDGRPLGTPDEVLQRIRKALEEGRIEPTLMGISEPETDREGAIRSLALDQWQEDGQVEIDDSAVVSEGDDNGAYVQAWVWVDFAGTYLTKDGED